MTNEHDPSIQPATPGEVAKILGVGGMVIAASLGGLFVLQKVNSNPDIPKPQDTKTYAGVLFNESAGKIQAEDDPNANGLPEIKAKLDRSCVRKYAIIGTQTDGVYGLSDPSNANVVLPITDGNTSPNSEQVLNYTAKHCES